MMLITDSTNRMKKRQDIKSGAMVSRNIVTAGKVGYNDLDSHGVSSAYMLDKSQRNFM